jgi:hypothetical protein
MCYVLYNVQHRRVNAKIVPQIRTWLVVHSRLDEKNIRLAGKQFPSCPLKVKNT